MGDVYVVCVWYVWGVCMWCIWCVCFGRSGELMNYYFSGRGLILLKDPRRSLFKVWLHNSLLVWFHPVCHHISWKYKECLYRAGLVMMLVRLIKHIWLRREHQSIAHGVISCPKFHIDRSMVVWFQLEVFRKIVLNGRDINIMVHLSLGLYRKSSVELRHQYKLPSIKLIS